MPGPAIAVPTKTRKGKDIFLLWLREDKYFVFVTFPNTTFAVLSNSKDEGGMNQVPQGVSRMFLQGPYMTTALVR